MKALKLRKNEIKIIELNMSHKEKEFEKWKKKLDKDIMKQFAFNKINFKRKEEIRNENVSSWRCVVD